MAASGDSLSRLRSDAPKPVGDSVLARVVRGTGFGGVGVFSGESGVDGEGASGSSGSSGCVCVSHSGLLPRKV